MSDPTKAQRQRRWRRRIRDGLALFKLELPEIPIIEKLLAAGWLDETDLSHETVSSALRDYIEYLIIAE
jgi:hypothetical protein